MTSFICNTYILEKYHHTHFNMHIHIRDQMLLITNVLFFVSISFPPPHKSSCRYLWWLSYSFGWRKLWWAHGIYWNENHDRISWRGYVNILLSPLRYELHKKWWYVSTLFMKALLKVGVRKYSPVWMKKWILNTWYLLPFTLFQIYGLHENHTTLFLDLPSLTVY